MKAEIERLQRKKRMKERRDDIRMEEGGRNGKRLRMEENPEEEPPQNRTPDITEEKEKREDRSDNIHPTGRKWKRIDKRTIQKRIQTNITTFFKEYNSDKLKKSRETPERSVSRDRLGDHQKDGPVIPVVEPTSPKSIQYSGWGACPPPLGYRPKIVTFATKNPKKIKN